MLNIDALHSPQIDPLVSKLSEFGRFLFESEAPSLERHAQLVSLITSFVSPRAVMPNGENEAYGRHVIYNGFDFEIMLANWRPGMECAPHDHGKSSGRVVALTGVFQETSYKFHPKEGLLPVSRNSVNSPAVLSVGGDDVHSMVCQSPEGGLTLHFYQPSIPSMNVFDSKNRCIYDVTPDCGAWIPKPEQILSVTRW